VSGKRVSLADFGALFGVAAGYVLTGVVSRRFDRSVLALLLGYVGIPGNPWVRRIEEWMSLVLGDDLPNESFHQHAVSFCCAFREDQWIRARAMHRSAPLIEIELEGAQHLEEAEKNGRGAVLWNLASCSRIVTHMVLQREGVDVVLLSGAVHGATSPVTSFGLRVIAPLRCRVENRFLAERVIIPMSGSLRYMRTLMERLSHNGCVFIEGERVATRQNVHADVFGRSVAFAPGAPGLAWKMGSALLPVHVIREGILQYRVVIQEPIERGDSLEKSDFIARSARQFAHRLERHVLAHPSDWHWEAHTVTQILRA
jgi:lauroyl/myristoyl acyltransferase